MHRTRCLSLALITILVVAACSGSEDTTLTDTGASTTAARAQTDPTKELRVGFTDDQYVLSGPDTSLAAYPLNTNVYEPLILMGPNYEMKPHLAERWEFRAPNTWRFFLRPGVKFHDGQAFNAQAVKTGLFDRIAKRRGGSTIKAGPDSAVVVDDMTIDFTPTTPNLRVPEQIVHPQNGVEAPGSDAGTKPVGTGPFTFVEYLPKERIVVQRNDAYWGTKANAARITFRFYPDGNARRLALEAGNIDLAYQIPGPDVKGLESRGFEVLNSPVGAYTALYANIHGNASHDLLKDIDVRHAVAMSIDRKQLVEGVLEGQATTDQTMIPPGALGPAASTIKGFPYDTTKAKGLLDKAGWVPGSDGVREKAGRKLKLTLVSGFPSAEVLRPIPTYVQSQLKLIGVDVAVVERPDSASYQALITSGSGDLFLEQGNQNDANVGFLPTLLFFKGAAGGGGSAPYQALFAPGPKFDQLLAPAITEPDLDKVRQHVADAMHEAIDVQAAVLPLAGNFRIYGMSKKVQGFTPHSSFLSVRWEDVGLTA